MIYSALLSPDFHYKYTTQLSLLLAIVLVLIFGSLPNSSLLWLEVQNSGHTFLFIPVASLIAFLLQNTGTFFSGKLFKLYIAALAVSLLIGVAIELIQEFIHGDASKMDIARDLGGIIVGLGLHAGTQLKSYEFDARLYNKIRAGLFILVFLIFAVSVSPLVFLSATYVQRSMSLPVIVDLSKAWTRPFLRLQHSSIAAPNKAEYKSETTGLTRVSLGHGVYPGISMIETFPDWSAYKTLLVSIFSPQTQVFDLVLRVHDDRHNHDYNDRFNTKLAIKKGVNLFQIQLDDVKSAPANREMNLTRIKEITLFSAQPVETELQFYLGKIILE